MRLLAADESDLVRSIFREVSRRSCSLIRVDEATKGRDASRLLAGGRFDLAFIDARMPGLAQPPPGRGRPGAKTFVTLMAESNAAAAKTAWRLSAHEFLRKPLNLRDVEAVIETYRRVTGQAKVLILENAKTLGGALRTLADRSIFRFDCYRASDEETARAFCLRLKFDLVFLDFDMAGLDGLAMLDHLLLHNAETRVIAVSRCSGRERAVQALRRGATAYLPKPIEPSDLEALLQELFGLVRRSGREALRHAEGLLVFGAPRTGAPSAGSPVTIASLLPRRGGARHEPKVNRRQVCPRCHRASRKRGGVHACAAAPARPRGSAHGSCRGGP